MQLRVLLVKWYLYGPSALFISTQFPLTTPTPSTFKSAHVDRQESLGTKIHYNVNVE